MRLNTLVAVSARPKTIFAGLQPRAGMQGAGHQELPGVADHAALRQFVAPWPGCWFLRKIENHRIAKTLVRGMQGKIAAAGGNKRQQREREQETRREQEALHDWRESRKLSSRITAASRSTALARFSMLMPLSRSTRWASTVVRRSSQNCTGIPVAACRRSAEIAGVFAAASFVPAHVQRIPHQYQRDIVVGSQFRQARQILANIGPLECFQALRGDPQLVAQRQPDAPFAQIEGQNPAVRHWKLPKARAAALILIAVWPISFHHE